MKNNIIETDILIIGGGTLGLFIYSQLKKKFRNIKVIDRGGLKPKISKKNNLINKGVYHKGTFKKRAFGIGKQLTLGWSTSRIYKC